MMFVETATTLVKVATMIMITAAYLSFLDAKRGLSLDYNNWVNVRLRRLTDKCLLRHCSLGFSYLAVQKISPNLQPSIKLQLGFISEVTIQIQPEHISQNLWNGTYLSKMRAGKMNLRHIVAVAPVNWNATQMLGTNVEPTNTPHINRQVMSENRRVSCATGEAFGNMKESRLRRSEKFKRGNQHDVHCVADANHGL
jgi:hypothetical protein